MSKKVAKVRWAENKSVQTTVRNFQSKLNSGSSIGGKLYHDLPLSNRKERRIMDSWDRKKKS